MGFLQRLLGRGRADAATADEKWSGRMQGMPALQSDEEQQATRDRMMAEMNAARELRGSTATTQPKPAE